MKEKFILFILWICLFFGWYNKYIQWLAEESENKRNLGFVGALAGGNLELPKDVICESLSQLSNDIRFQTIQEALWL